MNANLKQLLECDRVTLEILEVDGWRIESNGYSTYFRHEDGSVEPVPLWAIQLRAIAVDMAINNTKQQIREALGIETSAGEIPIGSNS